MDDPERKRLGPLAWLGGRSRRFWIGAGMLPLLYFASFGPACWLTARPFGDEGAGFDRVMIVYWPCGWLHQRGPRVASAAIRWWMTVGARKNHAVMLPTRFDGSEYMGVGN